ncbi:MAG: hypothetical protein R2741_02190 [Methanolobus sp.]
MITKLTVSFALLMIMFSTSIPGVYAMEDDSAMQMPEMNADQTKEMTLEMIENSIDSLTALQSELEDDDLLDSIDSLLEEMETMKTNLEATDDEDEISAIMEEFRSSAEEAPEEIREAIMQNRAMNSQQPMDGDRTMMQGDESMQVQDGEFPGNKTMNGEAPSDRPDVASSADANSDSSPEGNNGLLSGLISFIKSLF